MQNLWNAALIAALAAAGCGIEAESFVPGDAGGQPKRYEYTRGEAAPVGEESTDAGEAAPATECALHSDCEEGLACMNGRCAVVESGEPDAGAPEADGSMDIGPDAGTPPAATPDAGESASEPDASVPPPTPDAGAPADAGAPTEPDAGPLAPDAGAPDSGSQPAGCSSNADCPDGTICETAGTYDGACVPEPLSVTVVIEVPEGETVDASAVFCSTFGGGWRCAPFALGGTSGREIRATFENVLRTRHVFNVCLRLCNDPLNGVWMANQSSGLQQLDDPDVFVNEAIVPESLIPNNGFGANWLVDFPEPD